jgi:hypothetical protein
MTSRNATYMLTSKTYLSVCDPQERERTYMPPLLRLQVLNVLNLVLSSGVVDPNNQRLPQILRDDVQDIKFTSGPLFNLLDHFQTCCLGPQVFSVSLDFSVWGDFLDIFDGVLGILLLVGVVVAEYVCSF